MSLLRYVVLRLAPGLVGDEGRRILRDEARAALVAGVAPTLREWAGLTLVEQECWVAAGEELFRVRASATGLAAQGPRAAAEILAPVDGGEARRELEKVERDAALMNAATRAMSGVTR